METIINARIPQALVQRIEKIKKIDYTTTSQIIRTALKEYCEKWEQKNQDGGKTNESAKR